MSEIYNFDGKIRAINDEWAVLVKKCGQLNIDATFSEFAELKEEFFVKYIDYLLENKKEIVMKMCFNYLNNFNLHDDLILVYRPPCDGLGGTFAMKFKRVEKDNL